MAVNIDIRISERVLVIGPHYKNHRGGIGAVINIQKDFYPSFNFIPTYDYHSNNLSKALYFAKQLIKISLYLASHPQIRLLHIHSSVQGSFYRKLLVMLIAKILFRRKIINHLHSGAYDVIYSNGNFLQKKLMHAYFRLGDATVTVSNQWKTYISGQFNIAKVHFINNIIESPLRQQIQKPRHRINFLFLGLIGNNKGIFDLLDVLTVYKNELNHKCKLTIGGNGETQRLKQFIKTHDLEELVDFKGWVSGSDKHRLMQEADVFVLPSYSEGMPVSVLEAMSYGMPIISTPVGGLPEIVLPDRNGKLVNPGDKPALYHALRHYIAFPDNIRTHGRQSLRFVKEYFPEAVIPKVESLYKSLI